MAIVDRDPSDRVSLPNLLYQPRQAVRALQDRLLRATIELCYRGHPYYQRVMRERGLTPADLQSTDDLARLPVTPKQDFMADADSFRLQLPDLPVEERILREVMYTTGTTSGQPAAVYVTSSDHLAYLYHGARCAELLGLAEDDVIANCFPLTPYPMGAYVRAAHSAAAAGAAIITINPGRPDPDYPVHRSLDEAVRMIELHRATSIWGIASFVRRLLIRARELGADFSSLRACSITGEATSEAMREDMRQRMRDVGARETRIINRYGATEASSMLECADGSGWHNPSPDQVFLEVVDPESHRRLLPGEQGLLLITHLNRRGTILLRYVLGDIVALSEDPCPLCGRTTDRIISQPVRTKDMVKIKGMLVNLTLLQAELEGVPGLEEFQAVIQKSDPLDPFSMDELLLRLAAPEGIQATVGSLAVERATTATQVRPRVEFVPASEIQAPAGGTKLRRIVDLRP